ncbi:MAG: serine hydrolase, partial [Bacteroidetes bacterium]|nr:serine hydrolase [Bacteroidota bacterium]
MVIWNHQPGFGQNETYTGPPVFNSRGNHWVDSVFRSMSAVERIGQLFMAAAYSNRGKDHQTEIIDLIEKYNIGGLVFFQGGPVRQAKLTNLYQSKAKVPLLLAMDAEWGVGMRLDSTANYPYQMTLGAVNNIQWIYQMGQQVAMDFKRLGMHINFAPVADVNNNPQNPVISFRSFGQDKFDVTLKSSAYMKGLQDQGILAVGKHFPGHGDTQTDSHLDLPVILKSREELDSLELVPFRGLINQGIGGMMVAHLNIPSLDSAAGIPTTLSRPIIYDLLRSQMGFQGVIFSDAMNMKGITKNYSAEEAVVLAIAAGQDILETVPNIPLAVAAVEKAIKQGKLSQRTINRKCRKVLALKYWAGLNRYHPIQLKGLVQNLNRPQVELLNRQLTEGSLTLLKNDNEILPLKNIHQLKIASLSIGRAHRTTFQKMLSNYTQLDHFNLGIKSEMKLIEKVQQDIAKYDVVLVALHQIWKRPFNNDAYGPSMVKLVNELAASGKAVMTVFRNPYTLDKFDQIDEAEGLIMAFQQNVLSQELAAQLIFGAVGASGKLPVTVNKKFKQNDGLTIQGGWRLGYSIPEEVGMDGALLNRKIDSLVDQAISLKAIPGAQVLIAVQGKVVFNKTYGLQTYSDTIPVRNTDLYDLASITKVTTALPVLMQLVDAGKFKIDGKLGDYLPYFKGTNKANLTFREMLAHQAGLTAWIPYWKDAVNKEGNFKKQVFRRDSSEKYPYKVADHLYLKEDYQKKIFRAIKKSPVLKEKKYLYSGLSFYLYPTIIENITGSDYQEYLKDNFYHPLGAFTMTYMPQQYYPLHRVVPTEYDFPFRGEIIHGKVHDEGAAMMNGVSANAGLFGTSNDLAKLFQMYLNMGEY